MRLAAIPFVVSLVGTAGTWGWRFVRDNLDTRREVERTLPAGNAIGLHEALSLGIHEMRAEQSPRPLLARLGTELHPLLGGARFDSALRLAERYPVVSALREIDRWPLARKRKTALFVPQSLDIFWRLIPYEGFCTYDPLVGPALSGLAMVDGLPPVGCPMVRYYGMEVYRPRAMEQLPGDETPVAVCRRALRWGLERVVALMPDGAGQPRLQELSCRPGS